MCNCNIEKTAYSQRLVLEVLKSGKEYTTVQIETEVKKIGHSLSDIRSAIRTLRKKGFNIVDRWEVNTHGKRYKYYKLIDNERN